MIIMSVNLKMDKNVVKEFIKWAMEICFMEILSMIKKMAGEL